MPNPIYGTDFTKPIHVLIEEIRTNLMKARGMISDITNEYPGYEDRLSHVKGLLTCGLITLYQSKEEIKNIKISNMDKTDGKHINFRSRGVGADRCSCFVCGGEEKYQDNISAFVDSKFDGEESVAWFNQGARLDYREFEPNYIQVKIGACKKHLPNLKKLHKTISDYGVLRKHMIEDCIGED